jgi:hypothetical protein
MVIRYAYIAIPLQAIWPRSGSTPQIFTFSNAQSYIRPKCQTSVTWFSRLSQSLDITQWENISGNGKLKKQEKWMKLQIIGKVKLAHNPSMKTNWSMISSRCFRKESSNRTLTMLSGSNCNMAKRWTTDHRFNWDMLTQECTCSMPRKHLTVIGNASWSSW